MTFYQYLKGEIEESWKSITFKLRRQQIVDFKKLWRKWELISKIQEKLKKPESLTTVERWKYRIQWAVEKV